MNDSSRTRPKLSLKKRVCKRILSLLGASSFVDENLGCNLSVKHAILQKVLRINSHVPWPVHPGSTIIAPNKILRGTRFPGLSMGCYLDGRNGIELGKNVWIGPKVSIISMNHDSSDYTRYRDQPPIIIHDDCWIGAHAVILPGVILGTRTIVGAGAIVTKSFPEGHQILGGNPAKVIKHLHADAKSERPLDEE